MKLDELTRHAAGPDDEASAPGLECHPFGRSFLVCAQGALDSQAMVFTQNLAPDPEHTVVVIDLGAGHPAASWVPVAAMLGGQRGSFRLVPARPVPRSAKGIGQWLADQLGSTVLAADGPVLPAARGALFVPVGAGSGWLRLRPGQPGVPDSRRFPRPRWATAELDRPVALSATALAEPLPGGVWIHSPDEDAGLRDRRHWLQRRLAWRDAEMAVVLGSPSAPALLAGDIARFWELLPAQTRPAVRFVPYGRVPPPDRALGQSLADRLGHRVIMSAGIPLSGQSARDEINVHALGEDGTPGWRPFALELGYLPRASAGAAPPQPSVVSHLPPIAGLPEVSPGVYGYGPDVVLEVIQSGLWLRPAAEPPGGATIRSQPIDPRHPVVRYDAAPPRADRMRQLAMDVAGALDPGLRGICRVLPASSSPAPPPPAPAVTPPRIQLESGPPGARPDPVAAFAASPGPAADPPAAAHTAARSAAAVPRVQPVPRPEACVIPPARGIDGERAWLRQAMSQQYDAAASTVMRVLSEEPGLRGDARGSSSEVLTDLVAVRLYLTGHAQRLDDAVRTAQVGPHVPFGRCVAAGLRRLPTYRGATRLRAALADAEWQWYGSRHLVTEWAFCPALATGQVRLPGSVEFLIWSVTARRASLLEPSVPSHVLFLAGTNFKVLRVRADGRREVLLRELSAAEIAADGRVEVGRVPLDDIALTGLEKASDAWQRAESGEDLPAGYGHRFASPPGLIAAAGASESRGSTWEGRS
jgi:hypothetical protein